MKTLRTIIVALLALTIGGVVGAAVATHRSQADLAYLSVIHAAASAGDALSALKRLRLGDTNAAILSLELHLDGQIVGLKAMLDAIPKPHRESDVMAAAARLLERAEAYRAAHPPEKEGTGGSQ